MTGSGQRGHLGGFGSWPCPPGEGRDRLLCSCTFVPQSVAVPVADEKRRVFLPHVGGQARQPLSPSPPPGTALQCYYCKSRVSNEECNEVQKCTLSETQGQTERVCEWPCCPLVFLVTLPLHCLLS